MALTLIDRDGLESFSTRRLGVRLGVQAMSLYNYFPDRQSLLEAVVDLVIAEIPLEYGRSGPVAALRALAFEHRAAGLRHPHCAVLLATLCPTSPTMRAYLDTVCGQMQRLGLPPARVAHWFVFLGHFLTGAILADFAATATMPGADRGARPVVPCAHLDLIGPFLGPGARDRIFAEGVENFLALMRAEARKRPGRGQRRGAASATRKPR